MGTHAERTYAITRSQLIDALASTEIRNVAASGPMAGKVLADDVADAILFQLRECEECGRPPLGPCAAPPGERCLYEK